MNPATPPIRPHLCLVNSLRSWGGAEVWFLETALKLQERGHRITILCQPGSQLEKRSQDAEVPCVAIPIRMDAAPWTLFKLARFFRRQQVTSIVANLTKDLKASALAGKMAGIPIILSSRESDFPLKNKLYYRWYFNRLATGMLVNSEATRKTVCQSAPWLHSDRVHLLYKGIDLDRFTPSSSSPEQPTVGFVGQLIVRKGIRELMTAWAALEKKSWPKQPRLALAGEGPLKGELESWRQTLQHPDAVTLQGYVEDITSFLQGLSLLAMPSFAEGFGLAAAEAGACAVPVVAAQASSLPEIVRHEKTGLLVPPGDSKALENGLVKLLKNPDHARELGQAGRRHISTHFDQEGILDRLERLTGLGNIQGQDITR